MKVKAMLISGNFALSLVFPFGPFIMLIRNTLMFFNRKITTMAGY